MAIQQSILSMLSSAGAIQQQKNENTKKALDIALSAVTGGAAGAAKAVARNVGASKEQQAFIGDFVGGETASPQALAAQRAEESSANEVEAKQTQKQKFADFLKSQRDRLQARSEMMNKEMK